MNLDWKKIGLVAFFVGAVILFGFFIYYFFFRPLIEPTVTPPTTNTNQINGQLPATVNINGRIFTINANTGLPITNTNVSEAVNIPPKTEPSDTAQGGLTKAELMTKTPSLFATNLGDGSLLYYNAKDGKFYTLSTDGDIVEFNSKVFFNVNGVTWSKDRRKAILEYPDGSNIIYDFTANQQITLPANWYDFSFAPNDEKIAFKSDALDPANRFLAIAKTDGSQPVILENMGDKANNFQVDWSPNNQMVASFIQGKDLNRSEIYFIGTNKENFKLMVAEGRGFVSQWSPDGDKMVYSVYNSDNDYKPKLWIVDAGADTIGNNRSSLDLNTWTDKCTFTSNDKLYCAVPTQLPYGSGLDVNLTKTIADQIYQIDLKTGFKTLLALPSGNHTISQIMVNENNNTLFFSDANSNLIYKINL